MINRLARKAATFFCEAGVYNKEEKNIYTYGFELLISSTINIFLISIISSLIDETIGVNAVLPFCLAFIPLRITAGGFHARSHISCISGFCAIYIICSILTRFITPQHCLVFGVITIVFASATIIALAPVQAKNKDIPTSVRVSQRKRSLICIILQSSVIIPFLFLCREGISATILYYFCAGIFVASFLLVLGAIGLKYGNNA